MHARKRAVLSEIVYCYTPRPSALNAYKFHWHNLHTDGLAQRCENCRRHEELSKIVANTPMIQSYKDCSKKL